MLFSVEKLSANVRNILELGCAICDVRFAICDVRAGCMTNCTSCLFSNTKARRQKDTKDFGGCPVRRCIELVEMDKILVENMFSRPTACRRRCIELVEMYATSYFAGVAVLKKRKVRKE